jgi:glucokinase
MLRSYLADHTGVNLNHAALAVANPVSGDYMRMTNRDWEFSTDEVRRALGLHTLLVVNDFTALAMSLPGLKPADLMQVGGGKPASNSVIGVLGPGTGLGVSGVIPTVDGFVTLGSEGGHTNFAPADEREYAILQYAWQTWSHVSTERLISGPGMEIIYRAIAKRNGRQVRDLTSQEIISGALTDKDPLCLEVLECFCAMLGGATANLAVTLGAFGGMFIGGGIVPRLGDWFASSPFRARFEAKGRFTSYLAEIPTYVITTPNPGVLRRGDDFVRTPARPQRRQHADGARAAPAARTDPGRAARGATGAGAAAPCAERADCRYRAPGRSEPADRDPLLPLARLPRPGRFQTEVRQQPDRRDSRCVTARCASATARTI